jgi:hypothetical protein
MATEEVARVLERLVEDDGYRQQVQDDPEYLAAGHDLSPGEAGLLTAVTEAAYGLNENLAFQHRMCAVAADDELS